MIEFFSRRRAAIEARYAELVRDYRTAHGHDPDAGASHQLARQANLDTRQGKQPPRSLAGKRAAWREELTGRFGAGAVGPADEGSPLGPAAEVPAAHRSAADLTDLAERTVATVAARRSTWTVWNVRAEVERLLRAEVAFLPPGRHREPPTRSPRSPSPPRTRCRWRRRRCSTSRRTAARRRGVGVHRARRRPLHQPGRP